jgi:RNA polymerase sigma factor (sigma-70 family)
MYATVHADPALVSAAQRGDRQALDVLVADHLPLVYNVVGRALHWNQDVDDVVQETLIRMIDHLSELEEPAAFRSWLVAIAVRQIRDRRRSRTTAELPDLVGGFGGPADPGADFVDLTILRLALTDQRRETAVATRWLEPEDRELLSLWWLECSGELSRAELADALNLSASLAAVRVQRMKARLESARAVVRALESPLRCAELANVARGWDGHPSSVWRKRLVRHTRDCIQCAEHWNDLVAADRLLAEMALVPVSAMLANRWLRIALAPRPVQAPSAALSARAAGPTGRGHKARPGRVITHLSTKTIAMATVTFLAAGAAIAYAAVAASPAGIPVAAANLGARSSAPAAPAVPSTITTTIASAPATPAAAVTTTPTRATASAPATRAAAVATTRAVPHASPVPVTAGPAYGQTVDHADAAPSKDQFPGTLPQRPEGTLTFAGNYSNPFAGALGGKYLLLFDNQYLTITGKGYFLVRWEVAWFNRTGAQIRMPTWTGLEGKLFHVASGGGRRMDDSVPGEPTPAYTWMGNPKAGYDTLPAGAQQMWQNEYYYLDGSVTLHENEGWDDYNLGITPVTHAQIVGDIDTRPGTSEGVLRYGLVRDTGTDAAPVPQYLTRKVLPNLAPVPQESRVE